MNDSSPNDVFEAAESAPRQIQTSVKTMLQRIEATDASVRPQSKRSRESTGSIGGESSLMGKLDDLMHMIRKESQEQREAIVQDLKKELTLALKGMETKIDHIKLSLEKRVEDVEKHTNERDILVEKLSAEVEKSRSTIKALQEEAELRDMECRAPELILSGKAVPPKPRTDTAYDATSEDLRCTALGVIRRAFPRAEVEVGDLAEVRRIGGRVLLCRFVHTGSGSLRNFLYDNRMDLRNKTGDDELFISESLIQKHRDIFRRLLELKKQKKLYCVFTRFGFPYCKVQKDLQKVLVDSVEKVDTLF